MTQTLPLAQGLNADEIGAILPHRHPFRLLDRVVELEPGRRAVAWKNVSVAEPCFTGHFPQTAIFPGVLILEALAQLAGVVHASSVTARDGGSSNGRGSGSPRIGYLAAVRNIKFMRLVRPGDRLVLSATLGATFGNLVDFTVDATVDGEVAASGRLAIADPAQEIQQP